MKLKVIGWTSYDNSAIPTAKNASVGVISAIVDEIKEQGLCFTGEHMQEKSGCVPVLNDGKKQLFSRRGFGGVMAEAHGYMGAYDYATFSDGYSSNGAIFPKNTVFLMNDIKNKIESDLNETIEVDKAECKFDKDEITIPYTDRARYIASGDTLKIGDKQFLVIDALRKKDVSDKVVHTLQFTMWTNPNYQRAEKLYEQAPFVVVVTVKEL